MTDTVQTFAGTGYVAKSDGKKLIIEIDLGKSFGLSKSGKSNTVASSNGNVSVPGSDKIKLGLNVYKLV